MQNAMQCFNQVSCRYTQSLHAFLQSLITDCLA